MSNPPSGSALAYYCQALRDEATILALGITQTVDETTSTSFEAGIQGDEGHMMKKLYLTCAACNVCT